MTTVDCGTALRPPPASYEWNLQHVLLEGGTRLDAAKPAFEMVEPGALRHQTAKAIGHHGCGNVAHGERITGEKGGLGELRIEDPHSRGRPRARCVDGGVIAFFRRRADQPPEHPGDRGRGDR